MFSGNTIEQHKAKLIKLSEREQAKFDDYLRLVLFINTNEKEEMKTLFKKLEPYTANDIYKFAENGSTFKIFIQKSDCPLTKSWPKYLKDKGFIGEAVSSLDKTMTHTLYDEYVGAFLYSDYLSRNEKSDKSGARFSLNMACEFGLYQALIERTKINKEIIKTTEDDRKRVVSINELLTDTKMLTNLYGSIGYFHAAMVLIDIGNYFSNLNTDASAGQAKVFHEAAAENFFSGSLLLSEHSFPENEKILKIICKDDVLKTFGFKDAASAEKYFLEPIDNKITPHDKIRTAAKHTIDKILSSDHQFQLK
ncbi:MAG: DUF5630 domain-containing protein [Gammaproteobacteria bacterium]|nr:DUF5630 domain-containing protein [Gammaproteobacteria bacterium]